MATLTASQTLRIRGAIVQKALRLLLLPEAPFGSFGEISEFGLKTVRADHAIREMLFGLQGGAYDDITELWEAYDVTAVAVTAAEVIRAGFDDPAVFTAERTADVTDAIESARDWVQDMLAGFGVA